MKKVKRFPFFNAVVILIAAVSIIFLLASCSLFQKTNEGEYVAAIGSDGGSLDTGIGASITIPEGALKKTVEIQINPYLTPDELPEHIGEMIFDDYSVVEFLPDGLEFDQPVMITLPAVRELTPGDQIPLILWNEKEGYWEVTDLTAIVNEDGKSYSAEISHFSSWSGGGEGGDPGRFNTFDPYDSRCESNLLNITWTNWIADIEDYVSHIGKGFPKQGCCVEETGYRAYFKYSDSNYCPNGMVGEHTVGNEGDPDEWPPLMVFTNKTLTADLYLEIQIYRGRAAPKVTFNRPECINLSCVKDKEERISVNVTCGKELDNPGVPGAYVEFAADGQGSVEPTQRFTDSGGTAYSTLTVKEPGLTNVSATVQTCQGTEDFNSQKKSHMVCIDDCKKMQLQLDMSFTHGGADVPWNISNQITAYVEYTVDKETGQITSGSSMGSQQASVTSTTEHCSASGISAPSFSLKIVDGYVTESHTHVKLVPESLPMNFTMTCEYPNFDEPVNVPVPPYSALFGSVLGKHLDLAIPGQCASEAYEGFLDGSGSEGFGESPPIKFEYKVNLFCIERECKICE